MTLRHLEVFLTVCKYNSMTQAASELNMSQPAISMMIKELESYYGVKLFDRMNRKIYLTAPGETLKKYAENILFSYHEVFDLLKESQHSEQCRIGCNVTIGETILPELLSYIQKNHPQLKAKITINNNQEIEKLVYENLLDFAIVENIEDANQIEYIPFYKEEQVMVCQKGANYSIHELKDVLNYPLLIREIGSGNRKCVDIVFNVYDLKMDPYIESVSDLALIKLAMNGQGIAFVSQSLASEYSNNLDIISIRDIHFIRHFYIIFSNKKYLSSGMLNCIHELSKLKLSINE